VTAQSDEAAEYATPVSPLLTAVGDAWWLLLFTGIVTAALGVVVLAWPSATLHVVAIVFGVYLVLNGLFRLVASVGSAHAGVGRRVLLAIAGLLSLAIGVICLRNVVLSVAVLALAVGLAWLIDGTVDLVAGVAEPGLPDRGWLIARGVLGVIAGFVVFIWPGLTVLVLLTVGGIWLIALGIMQVFGAFRLRHRLTTAI
jgi:uncharacterized membrane protein HdeD (DUF308 family)